MTALLAALLVLLSVLPTQGAEHAWLVGRWELTHAPDGDPKDWVGRAETRNTSTYDKVQ